MTKVFSESWNLCKKNFLTEKVAELLTVLAFAIVKCSKSMLNRIFTKLC